MKKNHILLSVLFFVVASIFATTNAQTSKIEFEEVKKKCQDLPRDKRVRVKVSRFTASSNAAKASGQFGEELTTILTNALQETSCFRVMESNKHAGDLTEEIAMNESGATNGSGPQRGKMLGAQVILTAEITEFNEGKGGASLAGISVSGSGKAKVGLIVKMIDPQTGDILFSKSVEAESKKSGFSGLKVFGLNLAGETKVSPAMSDAVEQIIFKTVEVIVKEKDNLELPGVDNAGATAKKWDKTNCNALSASSRVPKIMVVVPEFHITSRIPDPAGETEILRKFIEAGYSAIDPSIYATIRNGAKFDEAVKNPVAAVQLGKEYGADIIIFGEAFSQLVNRDANANTCRARVEVRAVRTDNAEILATNGLEAGGQDIAEFPAAKRALKNAGGQVADYMIEQICNKAPVFSGGGGNVSATPRASGNRTVITVSNVNFTKLTSLVNALKANSKVKDTQKSLSGSTATVEIVHEGDSDDIADALSTKLGTQFEITGVESGKITLNAK
jgi:curli biogenesis system outer membrane secretion channel CsgG